MQDNKSVSYWKILIPVIISLGVVAYMFYSEIDTEVLRGFDFTTNAILCLMLAFMFMALRDVGYMWRIKLLCGEQLTWRKAFRVIMLWEFTSAITPSTIGGTSVAVVFLNKEGISVGRSATMVMLTAFFDEFFFVVALPVVVLLVGYSQLFAFDAASSIMWLIAAGYVIKLLLAGALGYGLFFRPRGLKWLLIRVFSLRILRRWKPGAVKAANDIVVSSRELRDFAPSFWLKAFLATALSWCSRFMVGGAIFMAFFVISDHLLVFARQIIMWVPMIVSPTPGGSGFAEYIFSNFLSDVLPSGVASGSIALIAILWRAITYYPYLIIGALIIPRWFATKFTKSSGPTQNR